MRPQIGLDPAFTIHDREDSADLMNLVRHELGFSKTAARFPTKGTCLQIYSRCVNTELPLGEILPESFPWCTAWEAELQQLFGAYVEAKQRQNVLDYDDLLLYWAQMVSDPELAAEIGGNFDHVLVDEYQDTNRLQSTILLGLKPDGMGLTVVGDDAQSIYAFRGATVRNILDYPAQFAPAAADHHAGAQLPLDPGHPRRRQWRHRPRQGAVHQEPLERSRRRHAAAAGQCPRRGRTGELHRRAHPGEPRRRDTTEAPGSAVPDLAP